MKEKIIQKKEHKNKVVIPVLCIIIAFCSVSLLLCYAEGRTKRINCEIPDGILSVLPGDSVSTANFEFTMKLPDAKDRQYDLIIYDVAFVGGDVTFADMNEGQWEFSMDGETWFPIILSKGECLLQADVSAGKKILLIRAANELDLGAAGGNLNFKLKLKENLSKVNLWILIGIIAGNLPISVIYLIVKNRTSKKT